MSDPINPAHYRPEPVGVVEVGAPSGPAVETIDTIRKALGDPGFVFFCRGNVLKYRARAGRKTADPSEDLAKAAWYEAMADHVASCGLLPDPRAYRAAK